MVLSTTILRFRDGLPLSASVDDPMDEKDIEPIKKQAKIIVRRLTGNSAPAASIESGNYAMHYIISNGIIYLTITNKSYPRKLAFSFLQELDKEFYTSHSTEINKPDLRPYAFIGFDNFIQKTKRLYSDTTVNLEQLNNELQDVTRVMTKNIEDLLYRGDSLDKMSDMSSSLRDQSKKYKRAAVRINFEALLKRYVPVVGLSLFVLFFFWYIFIK